MRRYGAFDVPYAGQQRYEAEVAEGGVVLEDGTRRAGFKTPSGKLELLSPTLEEWGWGDEALPRYIQSHIHWRELDESAGEMVLLPTFRLPTLIHTRSANSKWLQEISHTNPLWVHPRDAERIGIAKDDLARVRTRIGHFVLRVWVTEGIHPGIVACSHHVGRWRMHREIGGQKMASALVDIERGDGTFRFRQREGVSAFDSADPDSRNVWWHEVGVNQNLTFPVQPDPVSGMHCWHQKVVVEPARDDDRYGDVFVDTRKSREIWAEWLTRAKPAPGPGNLRRPLWLNRPLHPAESAYSL
jgi:anaerobic selenocysteine-containing dehydrogenase